MTVISSAILVKRYQTSQVKNETNKLSTKLPFDILWKLHEKDWSIQHYSQMVGIKNRMRKLAKNRMFMW